MAHKILYIGHYREPSGWGRASIEYIRSLLSIGVDVVSRCVYLNSSTNEIPPEIKECEAKSSKGCDVVIQHVIPDYMEYNANFKNIGILITETNSIEFTGWPFRLNLLDEVWVPCDDGKFTAQESQVKTPVFAIPHATDINKYKRNYPKPELPPNFTFYFIGENIRRKHLSSLLVAFHTEFDRNEPVQLLIKTNKSGISSHDCFQEVLNLCNGIKSNLRLYPNINDYHKEIIVCDFLSEEQLYGLHQACDCFVNTSFGEAWSYPTFDAMGFGNLVISSDYGGPIDYLPEWSLVSGQSQPVLGAEPILQDLWTGRENWVNVDILRLRMKMRAAYRMPDESGKLALKEEGKKRAANYSYQKIGQMMMERINAIH